MTRAVKSILLTIGLLLLSGCFTVDMSLQVSSEDTVSGTLVFAVDKSMATGLAELDEDGDGLAISVDDLPEGASVEPYDQDGRVGQKVTFDEVPLDELNQSLQQEDGGTFSLVRDGDTFVFTGEIETSEGSTPTGSAGADIEGLDEAFDQMLATASFTVEVTFPGQVLDTNGTVDGTTVSWDVDLKNSQQLTATASASADLPADADEATVADEAAVDADDSGFPVVPVVIGAVVLAAVIVAVVVLLNRRRAAG